MSETRSERDSMGTIELPVDAYYGPETERARRNFPISDRRFSRSFIWSLGLIKRSAAEANLELGKLDALRAGAIAAAASEVMSGSLDREFVVDVYQTGSGTSSNMNANEVIASRGNEILGCRFAPPGERIVHPNDHVNMGQSSNDVIPSASHVAAAVDLKDRLLPVLQELGRALEERARAFHDVIKIGRTHLMDATPITLEQECGGWSAQVRLGVLRITGAMVRLEDLALGGTAVGTGLNAHRDFARKAIERIASETGIPFREAGNHFEAQGARDAMVEMSGVLKTVAVSLMKVANDVRWLGSGPRCGLGELRLPPVQPGSSIMPGKVNPVIAESLAMVCAQVIGNDTTITIGGQSGNLQLNVMIPVMTANLLESIALLAAAARNFQERCIEGMDADRDQASSLVEKSLAMATALAPLVGHETAAEIAQEAARTGRTIREVAESRQVVDADALRRALDPWRMLLPNEE